MLNQSFTFQRRERLNFRSGGLNYPEQNAGGLCLIEMIGSGVHFLSQMVYLFICKPILLSSRREYR